jgi:hypothetical protein
MADELHAQLAESEQHRLGLDCPDEIAIAYEIDDTGCKVIADLFWGEHRLIVTADNAMSIGNELMKIAILGGVCLNMDLDPQLTISRKGQGVVIEAGDRKWSCSTSIAQAMGRELVEAAAYAKAETARLLKS